MPRYPAQISVPLTLPGFRLQQLAGAVRSAVLRRQQVSSRLLMCTWVSTPINHPESSGANAGGYCHRSDLPGGGVSRTVFFSNELTPRHD